MRFFYVRSIKKYIFLPAAIVFFGSLILQFVPAFFMPQLEALAQVKSRLGYTTVFFPVSTFLSLRLLFSLFYASIAGILGLLYFRLHFRRQGHTILVSNSFKSIAGIGYLLLIFGLFHSEKLAVNPITLPQFSSIKIFPAQLATTIKSFFVPNFRLIPQGSNSSSPNSGNSANSSNNNIHNPLIPPANNSQQSNPAQQQPQQQAPARMATAQELFSSLNAYRQKNGIGALQWDNSLANYAQGRANLYASLGHTDNHAGFITDTGNGLNYKLFFYGLGEGSSYGAVGDGTYIIEQWYGNDGNQLRSSWTYVGIGVAGSATNFTYGAGKTDSFHQN